MVNEIDSNKDYQNLVMLFADARNVHLGKDICIIPNYLAGRANIRAYLACENEGQKFPNREDLTPHLKIVHYSTCETKWRSQCATSLRQIAFVTRNANRIDYLFACHFSTRAKLTAFFYRLRNRTGKIWIKMDASTVEFEEKYQRWKQGRLSAKWKRALNRVALKFVSVVSLEENASVDWLKKLYPCEAHKIHHVPSPINTPLLKKLGYGNPDLSEKENLIITVARIGSLQKNNEMMLDALSSIDMRGWRFAFIGPIDDQFKAKIKSFYTKNPELVGSVIFTGSIDDKKELYSWYNKAKIFCLTSRYEGFCNAQLDALHFGLYHISTPVNGLGDIGGGGRFAKEVRTVDELRAALISISRNGLESSSAQKIQTYSSEFQIEKICETLVRVIGGGL